MYLRYFLNENGDRQYTLAVAEIPPFLVENTYEQQLAAGGGEPAAAPPRRLRNDSYLGAVSRDNVMVRARMQIHSRILPGLESVRSPEDQCWILEIWLIPTAMSDWHTMFLRYMETKTNPVIL